MTNTFINKVVAERQVLEIVNRAYSGRAQLAGLSSSAIQSWRGKVTLSADHPLIDSLTELGFLTQTLSNRSNESFTPLNPTVELQVQSKLAELPGKVAMARSKS